MKTRSKKIRLDKETVRNLDPAALGDVAAAYTTYTGCPSVTCAATCAPTICNRQTCRCSDNSCTC